MRFFGVPPENSVRRDAEHHTRGRMLPRSFGVANLVDQSGGTLVRSTQPKLSRPSLRITTTRPNLSGGSSPPTRSSPQLRDSAQARKNDCLEPAVGSSKPTTRSRWRRCAPEQLKHPNRNDLPPNVYPAHGAPCKALTGCVPNVFVGEHRSVELALRASSRCARLTGSPSAV